MKRNNFVLWFIFMLLIVVGGGVTYYFTDTTALLQEQKANGPDAGLFSNEVVAVSTDEVVRDNIAVTIGSIGMIAATESTEIHSDLTGKVDEIGFQEGQAVKEGDVLLEIDSRAIREELEKAEADLEQVQSAADMGDEIATANLLKAHEAVNALREKLEETQIKAPFDGVVGLRNFSIGNLVQLGQTLTSIDSIDPMKIEFSIPEKNFSDIHEGQEVNFTVDAYPDLFFKGEVYAIDSRVNAKTRSFEVKAMASNAENKLRSGMYARLQIPVAVHEDALVVPADSIVTRNDKTFVYVIENDRARRVPVSLGIRQDNRVEILENAGEGPLREGPLSEGQVIAVQNAAKLRNKSRITVLQQPLSQTEAMDKYDRKID